MQESFLVEVEDQLIQTQRSLPGEFLLHQTKRVKREKPLQHGDDYYSSRLQFWWQKEKEMVFSLRNNIQTTVWIQDSGNCQLQALLKITFF